MNPVKILKAALGASVLMLAVSCSDTAKIGGVLKTGQDGDLIVKRLNAGDYETLDTLKIDRSGMVSYSVDVKKGDPEFLYLFWNGRKVASFIVNSGDKIKFSADTLGHCEVSGSEESAKLMEVEKDYAGFCAEMDKLNAEYAALDADSKKAAELIKTMANTYVKYYRDRVRYILANSRSLSAVPVMYQKVLGRMYVFNNDTDAIHYKNLSDSLSLVYPESRYVAALKSEAAKRHNVLNMRLKLQDAPAVGYPDIELADIEGKKVKLSEMKGKAVLLHFWSSQDAAQKIFNQDILKPLYAKYHSKGLDIYQVALDADKSSWASVVRAQEMAWTNVCDIRGAASPVAGVYNLSKLPATFIISGGSLVDTDVKDVKDVKSLGKVLDSLL